MSAPEHEIAGLQSRLAVLDLFIETSKEELQQLQADARDVRQQIRQHETQAKIAARAARRQAKIDAQTDAKVKAVLERAFRDIRIVNLYTTAEMSMTAVAEAVGVTPKTVRNVLRAEGVALRPGKRRPHTRKRKMTTAQDAIAADLRASGETWPRIAAALGCGTETARAAAARAQKARSDAA